MSTEGTTYIRPKQGEGPTSKQARHPSETQGTTHDTKHNCTTLEQLAIIFPLRKVAGSKPRSLKKVMMWAGAAAAPRLDYLI